MPPRWWYRTECPEWAPKWRRSHKVLPLRAHCHSIIFPSKTRNLVECVYNHFEEGKGVCAQVRPGLAGQSSPCEAWIVLVWWSRREFWHIFLLKTKWKSDKPSIVVVLEEMSGILIIKKEQGRELAMEQKDNNVLLEQDHQGPACQHHEPWIAQCLSRTCWLNQSWTVCECPPSCNTPDELIAHHENKCHCYLF